MRHAKVIAAVAFAALACTAQAQADRGGGPTCAQVAPGTPVNTIKEVFEKLRQCWKAPKAEGTNPIDITVIVSFNRSGGILGHPKITYETPQATDRDRLAYRVAVMETLQRCTPMPFTESMAGAIAGRPFAVQFRSVKPEPEKRTWLSPKIL